jgi:CheY-like chemotaxis protein
MSGHNGAEYRQAALAAGCDEFLPKPLIIADLRRAVERRLEFKL